MADANSGNTSGDAITAAELAVIATETIGSLTGYTPESATGLQWDGDKWLVTVDVRELERVPNTTDVMATYVVELGESGGILGYRRTHRFIRGHAQGD